MSSTLFICLIIAILIVSIHFKWLNWINCTNCFICVYILSLLYHAICFMYGLFMYNVSANVFIHVSLLAHSVVSFHCVSPYFEYIFCSLFVLHFLLIHRYLCYASRYVQYYLICVLCVMYICILIKFGAFSF